MKDSVRQRLLEINQAFYQQHASGFAATRYGFQPGWERIIHHFPTRCQVLDLGCGNGRLAWFLNERLQAVTYVGLDQSEALIAIARRQMDDLNHVVAIFHTADLTRTDWADAYQDLPVDIVTAFALLHHVPGHRERVRFLRAAASCLQPGGKLLLSNWRFSHNLRMQRKIVPWQTLEMTDEDVEPGDYLLDWKAEGESGLRYVHQLDEVEVVELAQAANLNILDHFHADGREGDLSLYSILQRP